MTEARSYRTELAARIRATMDDIAWVIRGLAPGAAHYTPAEGEWSIHEHLAHLRDTEQEVYLPLLRWATVPEMLDPLDYSRKEWHERRYDPAEQLTRIVDDLARIRDEELLIFRDLPDHIWTRWRTDTRWGPLTTQWVAEAIYRHALDHLQGVMALRQDINLAAMQPPAVIGGRTA
ncbi:MAG: DinB family protein [Dehalococcoidia bacterium]|nr:DinB family protein [Dehalococcoidia bacterium]